MVRKGGYIMTLEFKKIEKVDINCEYLADELLHKNDVKSFQGFLLEHLKNKGFENANSYHNWNDMRIVAYDALFVYCVEHDLESILEKLQKIKYK